jgi:hypothetical protein
MKIPIRYLPFRLSRKDQKKQILGLRRSRKLYKKGVYKGRPFLSSFHNKTSKHIDRARRIYHIENMTVGSGLAKKTGCSIGALNAIVKKGEGAYYSSGSRPNQTAQSWGLARLASSLTGGKSSAIDYGILERGCKHNGRAFRMARSARRKWGYGRGHTHRRSV